MAYTTLNREKAGQWVKKLIDNKGSPDQLALLQHAYKNDASDFVNFVENCIAGGAGESAYSGGHDVPSLRIEGTTKSVLELTDGHMYHMPATDIVKLYEHWKDIPETQAATSSLWGAITLSEIRDGRVDPAWLAVNRHSDGRDPLGELDRAIQGSETNIKKVDGLVRRILRWMMGHEYIRWGSAALYGNCSFAKAWWCGHLATRCVEILKQHPDSAVQLDVMDATSALQRIWPELADYISGKLRVVSEHTVLSGVILWSHEQILMVDNGSRQGFTRLDARNALLALGEVSSWGVLGAMSPKQVCSTLHKVSVPPENSTT